MTPERWRRITDVFHAVLAREPEARGALLEEACGADAGLRAEVEAMLAAHRDAGEFGEAPEFTESQEIEPRLPPGAMLGPYRIEKLIGSGGMGEVYRARDTRLERDVAVKVLPSRVASDERLRQRLDREAKALAALSHPHICPVFDVGERDGVSYLVMEFLEGETLAERLTRGPLPLEQALRCAGEVADALDKAHAQGVVHRDLKPNNVMLTKRGARLLDFGIAKRRRGPRLAGSSGDAHTAGASLTGEGHVIGTLQYMAPEQLNGEEADARSDIFALGAVLYEMVTGRKAFEGKSQASVIAAILEHEPPPLATLQPATPPALDHLIRTCLAKEPDQRWQSAADVGRSLAWIREQGSQAWAPAGAAWRTRRAPWMVAAGLGMLALVSGLGWLTGARARPGALVHAVLPTPPGVIENPLAGFALSPDGGRLAFVAQGADGVTRLWVQALDGTEARPLGGTEEAYAPFWSPDGKDIGFFAFGEALKRVPAAGGPVQVLFGPTPEPKGGTWSPDGRIVYVPGYRTGLFQVPAGGGESRALTALQAGETSHRFPQFLPDGRSLLFLVQTAEAGAKDDRSRIEVLDAGGARHEILKVNAAARYTPSGHLLFWREAAVHAQEMDPGRLGLRGEARRVAEGVALSINEWPTFGVSDQGTLVYHHATTFPWRLEWRERTGRVVAVPAPPGRYSDITLSSDGRRLVYVADNLTVRVLDLLRGTDSRLTFDEQDHFSPAWGPRGDWLAYAADTQGQPGSQIRRRRSSGSGEEEVLYSSDKVVRTLSWSPAGRWMAFEEEGDVFLLDLESRRAQPRIATPADEGSPRFSPDGRWLAYYSNESGRYEVYVTPALQGTEKWQVSSQGGYEPRWAPAGDELFFLSMAKELRVARVNFGKEPELGLSESLFFLSRAQGGMTYDVARDGRILVADPVSGQDAEDFKLVLNWPRLLERPAP
jgi:Tol biopolymer transport system component